MVRGISASILMALVLFLSCQDGGGLLPDLSSSDSRTLGQLEIPAAGTVVVPGETLTIRFLDPPPDSANLPDLLKVSLVLYGSSTSDTSVSVLSANRSDSLIEDADPTDSPTASPVVTPLASAEPSPSTSPTALPARLPLTTASPSVSVNVTASPSPVALETATPSANTFIEPDAFVEGSARADWKIANPFHQSTVLTIHVPDTLKPGLYTLSAVISSGGVPSSSINNLVFVEKKLPEVLDVQVYPGVIKAGNDGLIQAQIRQSHAEGVHIRWKNSDGVLSEQDLLGSTAWLQVKVPSRKGLYTYTLEIFPRKIQGAQFNFDAPVQKTFSIVVSDQAVAGMNDLEPAADYTGLLHFNGDLDDSGNLTKGRGGLDFGFTGAATFKVADKQFGYEFGAGTFISDENHSVFTLRPEGGIAPLGIVLNLSILDGTAGRVFSSRSADGKYSLSMDLDSSGFADLNAVFGTLAVHVRSTVPLMAGNHELFMAATVTDGYLDLMLASSGEVLGRALAKLDFQPVTGTTSELSFLAGQTRLGATAGPRLVIDEFGVYLPTGTPQGIDPYYFAMEQAYGNGLVLARSFMAPYLSSMKITGDVRIANGKLIMPAGSRIAIPNKAGLNQKTSFSLVFSRGNKGGALISINPSDTSKEPVILDSAGLLRQGKLNVPFDKPGSRLDFSLESLSGGKSAVQVGKARLVADLGSSDGTCTLGIESSDPVLGELELDSLLGIYSGDL